MINIAINGFGRIGRLFLRALSESGNAKNINVNKTRTGIIDVLKIMNAKIQLKNNGLLR